MDRLSRGCVINQRGSVSVPCSSFHARPRGSRVLPAQRQIGISHRFLTVLASTLPSSRQITLLPAADLLLETVVVSEDEPR